VTKCFCRISSSTTRLEKHTQGAREGRVRGRPAELIKFEAEVRNCLWRLCRTGVRSNGNYHQLFMCCVLTSAFIISKKMSFPPYIA